jgi:ABC-type multidrug transport system fused ATPase/permease subunit
LFENLNLQIKQGDIVGLVGSFGSGKSTLLQMLAGFNRELIVKGNLQLDGISIKDISKKVLTKKVGFIPQNLTLMPGTIEQNLTYGIESYSEEKLERILDLMGASFFYRKEEPFQNGLQTVILKSVDGKTKIELNEYQKACIVLAQALIKEPRILLLDEYFVHITGNEIGIEKCLRKLNDTKKVTILLTTKDTNTNALKFCNRVYTVDPTIKGLKDLDMPLNKFATMKRQNTAFK